MQIKHPIILSLFLLLSPLAFSSTSAPEQMQCEKIDNTKVKAGIIKFLKKQHSPITQVNLKIRRCVDGYLLAQIYPQNQATDAAFVYLQKKQDQWQVLQLGTSFDDDFLKKLPPALRDYSKE